MLSTARQEAPDGQEDPRLELVGRTPVPAWPRADAAARRRRRKCAREHRGRGDVAGGLFVAPERTCSPDDKGSDHALESMAMDRKGRGLEPRPAQGTTKDAYGGGDVITRHAENRNDSIGRRVARRHGA